MSYVGYKSQPLDFMVYADGVSVKSVVQKYALAPETEDGQPVTQITEKDVTWDIAWTTSPPAYVDYPKVNSTVIKSKGKNVYWEKPITTYSSGYTEEGDPSKSTMLDVNFINALGITAKKITVLQDNTDAESTENRIIFEADGFDTAGIVKIGGFNINSEGLFTGGIASIITEQYAVYSEGENTIIYTDEKGLLTHYEYIDENSRFYDPSEWPGLADIENEADYNYLNTRPLILASTNKTLLCYKVTKSWEMLDEQKNYDVWTRYHYHNDTKKWTADAEDELYLTTPIVDNDKNAFFKNKFLYYGTTPRKIPMGNLDRECVFVAGSKFGITDDGNVYAQTIEVGETADISEVTIGTCTIENQLTIGGSSLKPYSKTKDILETNATVQFTTSLSYSYRGGDARYSITFTPVTIKDDKITLANYKSATTQSLGTLNSIVIDVSDTPMGSNLPTPVLVTISADSDVTWQKNQGIASWSILARGYGASGNVKLHSITFNNHTTEKATDDPITITSNEVSYFTGNTTAAYYLQTASGIIPATNNELLLGLSDQKWNEIHATNVYATTFYASSDKRLKENIKEYQPKKSVLDLPVVEFDFKDSKSHHIGCIAQDLQEICPEIVYTNKEGYLNIAENKLVYLLLLETKALATKVSYLESELNKLRKD